MKAYKDMTEAERKENRRRIDAFVLAAHNACKKRNTVFEFECPLCHGTARAVKSGYNGHHRAACTSCDMSIME